MIGPDSIRMSDCKQKTGAEERKFRVLLAEESCSVRKILREELQQANWVEIVGEADKSQDTLAMLFNLRPDAVVVSTRIPDQGGFELLQRIKRTFASCATILTSRQPDSLVTETGRLLGAAGVCSVAHQPTQLVKLLRDIAEQNFDLSKLS